MFYTAAWYVNTNTFSGDLNSAADKPFYTDAVNYARYTILMHFIGNTSDIKRQESWRVGYQ